jgi:hypothetical protein
MVSNITVGLRLDAKVGKGVLMCSCDVANFDEVVAHAEQLKAPMVRAPHRIGM